MCIYLHKYSGSRRDTLPENPPKEEHVTRYGTT